MRYLALACDYDGTLAYEGHVDEPTLAALERLLATGRQLLLVTGRELPELQQVFPHLHLFARVVAENGALLYRPATKEEHVLTKPPPAAFVQQLRQRGVTALSVGRVVVATWRPHETDVLEAIRDQGLEMQVIFNKDAVMALPSGVNKATGLTAALEELQLSPHEVVGVGDAENDHAFLSLCECGVAVDNALPAVKKDADFVTCGARGAGVTELIDALVKNDLADLEPRLRRHHLLLATSAEGRELHLPAFGFNLLIAGPSGSGKSTAASSLLERLAEHAYQFCIIDPEGDYDGFLGAATLGNSQHSPTVNEILGLLQSSRNNVVANLVGMPLGDRPPFFLELLPRLQELRARTGRPHWLIMDEAHHLMPASWELGPLVAPEELKRALFITVHPGQVAPAVLQSVDGVLAVGQEPLKTIAEYCAAIHEGPPSLDEVTLEQGETFFWSRRGELPSGKVHPVPTRRERRRHTRKYAEGELPPERSFYFRGPDGKLKLRAQNLILFLQLADGVDDETWMHHLREGDYSRWIREAIKDETLATEIAQVEERQGQGADQSRALVRKLVERHYTLPAAPPLPMPGTAAAPTKN